MNKKPTYGIEDFHSNKRPTDNSSITNSPLNKSSVRRRPSCEQLSYEQLPNAGKSNKQYSVKFGVIGSLLSMSLLAELGGRKGRSTLPGTGKGEEAGEGGRITPNPAEILHTVPSLFLVRTLFLYQDYCTDHLFVVVVLEGGLDPANAPNPHSTYRDLCTVCIGHKFHKYQI
jgi:hypothetical protein